MLPAGRQEQEPHQAGAAFALQRACFQAAMCPSQVWSAGKLHKSLRPTIRPQTIHIIACAVLQMLTQRLNRIDASCYGALQAIP